MQYSYEHTFVQQYTLCAENPGFEIVQESAKVFTKGMSSRTFYAQHPVSISPRFSPTFFYRGANPALYSAPFFSTPQPKLMYILCTAVLIGSMLKALCSKLFMRRV